MAAGKTLRLHFTICVCSLIFALMLGILTFVYFREKRVLEDQVAYLGKATVLNLASSFRDSVLQFEYRSLQQTLPRLKEQGIVDYCQIFNDTQILASSDKEQFLDSIDDSSGQNALVRARVGIVSGPVEVFRDDGRYFEFISAIEESGPCKAIVRVGYNTRERIDSVVVETQTSLLWIFFCGGIVAVILSTLLAHAVVLPISNLASHAENVALEDYDKPIEVQSSAIEIQTLAQGLNIMRERIKAHIDELDEANHSLDRKVFELKTLYDVAETMNFKSYSPELLSYILDISLSALQAEWGSMWLYDGDEEKLLLKMVRGAGYDKHKSPKIDPGFGIAGEVFTSGEAIVSNDISSDSRFAKIDGQKEFEIRLKQIICVPLLVDNQSIGVLNVVNKKDGSGFDENDCSLLSALASQAARALEHAKLYDLAIKESKTGLYIPRYFQARLHEQITQARRYNQTFSVMITDIDHFKQVNDKYGHLIGDEVIIKIASFIHESLRENIDIASRWGGEEFAIILPRTDREGAFTFSERYRERVEKNIGEIDKGIPDVTVSVGIATFPYDGKDEHSIMKQADDALYEAKRTGRNKVCTASK